MTEKERNDYFYVCSLIEYIARETKNHRGDIVRYIGKEGIKNLLYDAEVNHCLSFEQVSDEVIEYYKIKQGSFDTISDCRYDVPSFLDIGKLYSIMIEDCAKKGKELEELIKIFTSFISDEISDFNTDLYYQNPNYIECSYAEGKLLAQIPNLKNNTKGKVGGVIYVSANACRISEKNSFENGVPILEGVYTKEEEAIFQKFVKRLEECEQEKFKID